MTHEASRSSSTQPSTSDRGRTSDSSQPEWHQHMTERGTVIWENMQTTIRLCKEEEDGELIVVKAAKRRNPIRDKMQMLRRCNQANAKKGIFSTEQSIKREVAIMKVTRHPHHVQLLDVVDDPQKDRVFISMEFLQGGRVQWQNESNEPLLTVEQTRRIFRDVVLGLEYLHFMGIIHRDIKPDNLIWTHNRTSVKIIDYGISHFDRSVRRIPFARWRKSLEPLKDPTLFPPNELTKLRGTDYFIAPEVLGTFHEPHSPGDSLPQSVASASTTTVSSFASRPSRQPTPSSSPPPPAPPKHPSRRAPVTQAIDIWSLGVTLYCFLFGSFPFDIVENSGHHRDHVKYKLYRDICTKDWDVPQTMGRCSSPSGGRRPTEPDSVIVLLDHILQKDPKNRVLLHNIKSHPWVLDGIPNANQWLVRTSAMHGCLPNYCRWAYMLWGSLCRLCGRRRPHKLSLPDTNT